MALSLVSGSVADAFSKINLNSGAETGQSAISTLPSAAAFKSASNLLLGPGGKSSSLLNRSSNPNSGNVKNDGVWASMFGKSPFSIGDARVANLLSQVQVPLEVDCDPEMDASSRLRSSLGLEASRNLTTCTLLNLTASLTGGQSILETGVMIGGVYHIVKNKDMTTAQGLSDAIYNLTLTDSRTSQYFDWGAKMASFNYIMGEAIRIGIPELVDTVLGLSPNDDFRRNALLNQLRTALLRSELSIVKECLSFCGREACLTKVPDMVKLLLQYYRFRARETATPAIALVDLKALLNSISTKWYLYEDDYGNEVDNLTVFTRISGDGADLLMMDDELAELVLLADIYKPKTAYSMLRGMYRGIPL